MSSEDFKREFNISAKIIYREWLMEAIKMMTINHLGIAF